LPPSAGLKKRMDFFGGRNHSYISGGEGAALKKHQSVKEGGKKNLTPWMTGKREVKGNSKKQQRRRGGNRQEKKEGDVLNYQGV